MHRDLGGRVDSLFDQHRQLGHARKRVGLRHIPVPRMLSGVLEVRPEQLVHRQPRLVRLDQERFAALVLQRLILDVVRKGVLPETVELLAGHRRRTEKPLANPLLR